MATALSLASRQPACADKWENGRGGGAEAGDATLPLTLSAFRSLDLSRRRPLAHQSTQPPQKKKKKKATRFSPGLLQSQLQWREEEEEPGASGGRARAGEVRGHVTVRAPPPHHVGDRPRPSPQWAVGWNVIEGAWPHHVTLAQGLRLVA